MTREEAILLLHDMKDTYDEIHENTNYEIGYEQMTALDMAIEALSATNLKEKFESAVPNCQKCAIKELWKETEKEDLVKAVRCKDCRWYENRYGEVCHNPRYGDGHANYSPPYVDEEYFCKDGERREE